MFYSVHQVIVIEDLYAQVNINATALLQCALYM